MKRQEPGQGLQQRLLSLEHHLLKDHRPHFERDPVS